MPDRIADDLVAGAVAAARQIERYIGIAIDQIVLDVEMTVIDGISPDAGSVGIDAIADQHAAARTDHHARVAIVENAISRDDGRRVNDRNAVVIAVDRVAGGGRAIADIKPHIAGCGLIVDIIAAHDDILISRIDTIIIRACIAIVENVVVRNRQGWKSDAVIVLRINAFIGIVVNAVAGNRSANVLVINSNILSEYLIVRNRCF